MDKIASYILSVYSFVFKQSLDKILDIGYQSKNGNPIPSFDEKLLTDLCIEAQNVFESESNILELTGDVTIVGDIHGSLHDLLRILHYFQQKKTKVLFLGDYVDRGNFSLECITLLFALKVFRPDLFFLIRGNHEFDQVCSQYGFKDEILNHHNPKRMKKEPAPEVSNIKDINPKPAEKNTEKEEQNKQYEKYLSTHNDMKCHKYTESLYDAFINTFAFLPIGAIINKSTFCIHGGISPRLLTIDSITNSIKRPVYTFEENELLTDVVWSDPISNLECLYSDNPRGRGYLFNKSAVMLFLVKNSIKRIIRGHECVKKGSFKHFNDQLVTVFSASSYDKNIRNYSAVLNLYEKGHDELKTVHFEPIDRLQRCDAYFYKVQPLEKNETKIPTIFSIHHPFLSSYVNIRMATKKKHNIIQVHKSQNNFKLHESLPNSTILKSKLASNSSSTLPSFPSNFIGSVNSSLIGSSNYSLLDPIDNDNDNDFSSSSVIIDDQQI